jgi:ATP synthase I chain
VNGSQKIEIQPADFDYPAAVARLFRFMLVVASASTVAAILIWDWKVGAGFAVGCAASLLSFRWLESAVAALSARAVEEARQQDSGGVIARFLLRYGLIAVVGYTISRVSPISVNGLIVGLFLPVAGAACEAVHEVYGVLAKRG